MLLSFLNKNATVFLFTRSRCVNLYKDEATVS